MKKRYYFLFIFIFVSLGVLIIGSSLTGYSVFNFFLNGHTIHIEDGVGILQEGLYDYSGTEDTIVYSGSSYDYSSRDYLQTWCKERQTPILKFDIIDLEGREVKSAKIELNVYRFIWPRFDLDSKLEIYALENNWSEGSVVYSDVYSDFLERIDVIELKKEDWNVTSKQTLVPLEDKEWIEIDVSDKIDDWISGENYGILLKVDKGKCYNGLYFRSSEYSEREFRPRLVLEFYDEEEFFNEDSLEKNESVEEPIVEIFNQSFGNESEEFNQTINSSVVGNETFNRSLENETQNLIPANDSLNENVEDVCTPNWQCLEWEGCFEGLQKRICEDLNGCGILEEKPETERGCCELERAYFSKENVSEGERVNLIVEGENCDKLNAEFVVYETDGIAGRQEIMKLESVFEGDVASVNWIAEFEEDRVLFFDGGNPEYNFKVRVNPEIESDNELVVFSDGGDSDIEGGFDDSGWYSWAKDNHNSRIADFSFNVPFSLKWKKELPGDYHSQNLPNRLYYRDGVLIFVYSYKIETNPYQSVCVIAVNASNGEQLWTSTCGGVHGSNALYAISDGYLFGGNDHAGAFKINLTSGEKFGMSTHGGPGVMESFVNVDEFGLYAYGNDAVDSTSVSLKSMEIVHEHIAEPVDDGMFEGSFSFPGVYVARDYLNFGDKFDLGSDDFTIMGWFKKSGVGNQVILSKGYSRDTHYEINVLGSQLRYRLQPCGYWDYFGENFSVNDNEWTHFALTYDHEYQRLYKNGKLVYKRAETRDVGSEHSNFYIGGKRHQDSLSGNVDEIAIFSRAFSGDEIESIYNSEIVPDSDTELLLHFDNESVYGENSEFVYDFSGKGNHYSYDGHQNVFARWRNSRGGKPTGVPVSFYGRYNGFGQPAANGGILYVPDGILWAYNSTNEDVIWQEGCYPKQSEIGCVKHYNEVTYSGDRVFVIGEECLDTGSLTDPYLSGYIPPTFDIPKMYVYNSSNGYLINSFEVSNPERSNSEIYQYYQHIVHSDIVYVYTIEDISAYSFMTGELLWSRNLTSPNSKYLVTDISEFVLSGDLLYVIDKLGERLFVLDKNTGDIVSVFFSEKISYLHPGIHTMITSRDYLSGLIVVDDKLFVSSLSGKLYCFESFYSSPNISLSSEIIPIAQVSNDYPVFDINVLNGEWPYSWEISSGNLPDGLNLNIDNFNHTVQINGTPIESGYFDFVLRVTDSRGNYDERFLNMTVIPDSRDFQIILQDGLNGYNGCEDAIIDGSSYLARDTNYGLGDTLTGRYGYGISESFYKRGLIKFEDIFESEGGLLPGDIYITKIELGFNKIDSYKRNISVYNLLADWKEDEVTWIKKNSTSNWGVNGTEIGIDRSDLVLSFITESCSQSTFYGEVCNSEPGEFLVDITSVANFIPGKENYGWLFTQPLSSAPLFYSCDYFNESELDNGIGKRPKLVITYKKINLSNIAPVVNLAINPSIVENGESVIFNASAFDDSKIEGFELKIGSTIRNEYCDLSENNRSLLCNGEIQLNGYSSLFGWFCSQSLSLNVWDEFGVEIEEAFSLSCVDSFDELIITTTDLRNGNVGEVYSDFVYVEGGSGYVWNLESGSLPEGLSLNSGSGEISGTPLSAGVYDFSISVESGGNSVIQELSIEVLGDGGEIPEIVCGDGYCNGEENCSTCAEDCGVCEPVVQTCSEQGGDICLDGEYCSGENLTASDSDKCCSVSCSSISCSDCSECGDGLFNFCDRAECESCSVGCYFIDELLGDKCYSCSREDCFSYSDDETSCLDDVCGFGNCEWNLSYGICQEKYIDCDYDNDGYDSNNWTCLGSDCDDFNENINPGENEVCNGVDDNCINGVDENNGDCFFINPDKPYCSEGVCVSESPVKAFDNPESVLVVFNNNSNYDVDNNGNGIQDSYEVAMAYAIKREIPLGNVLGVDCTRGTRSYYYVDEYDDFLNEIIEPIKLKLDELGRENINYIVMTYGIPYSITVDTTSGSTSTRATDSYIVTPFSLNPTDKFYTYYSTTNPYLEDSPTVGNDKGHFNHSIDYYGDEFYLVSRLDGANPDKIRDQMDGALYGEEYFYNEDGYYRGLGYVDTRYGLYDDFSGYPFGESNSDKRFAYATTFYEALNYPYKWETSGYEIGQSGAEFTDGSSGVVAENAMFYDGWYNYNQYTRGFRWLPGSAACDLNSNSAGGIRSSGFGAFIPGSLNDGLTCGVGVTGEPYLAGHAKPEVFIYYMTHGFSLGESGWLSIPYIYWRNQVIGDPLYAPFKDKTPVLDNSFARDFYVLDKPVANYADTNRSFEIYLTEGSNYEMAIFDIEYGTDMSLGKSFGYNYDYRHRKDFVIGDLLSDTTYYYRVTARDPAGNIKQGEIQSFKTSSMASVSFIDVELIQDRNFINTGGSVNFDYSGVCDGCIFNWYYGDGNEFSGKESSHAYNSPGVYDVILEINQDDVNKEILRGIVFVSGESVAICGNEICDLGESCNNCPEDCGECPVIVDCDYDNDGYDSDNISCGGNDCDDFNENINPGENEVCNGVDDNCINGVDENNGDCLGDADLCVNGECVECVNEGDCDDGIACSVDSCNSGICSNVADNNYCDNGDYCDGIEICSILSGCVSGDAVNCDDGIFCTIDSCNEDLDSCDNNPVDSLCDNGLWCDGIGYCSESGCQQINAPDCDDDLSCSLDSCSEGSDTEDNLGECFFDLSLCDCETDEDCDDGNPCTDDSCSAERVCVNINDDTNSCDDGNWCTVNDRCVSGSCVYDSRDVDDGVSCTIDSCNEVNDIVENIADDSYCDDGNICTDNVCDSLSGCIVNYNSNTCDDENSCTLNDICSLGICSGVEKDCSGLDDDCNLGTCNLLSGECIKNPFNEGGLCDDGITCTENDVCSTGDCSGSPNSNLCASFEDCLADRGCEQSSCAGCRNCDGWFDACDYSECHSNCDIFDDEDCYYRGDILFGSNCVNLSYACGNLISSCNDYSVEECGNNPCGLDESCEVIDKSCVRVEPPCVISLANDTKFWRNISCQLNNLMLQSRIIIQYDENNCGIYKNKTIFEFREFGNCDYLNWKPEIYFDKSNFDMNETTNFSAFDRISLSNLQGLRFKHKLTKTKIRFLERVNFSRNLNLTKGNFLFGRNWMYIDSGDVPELNKSAEIIFYNITIENPRLYRDGILCSDEICYNRSFNLSAGVYSFIVARFSNYSLGWCGDNICQDDESCSSCSGDCGSCSASVDQDGDDSGGSSGRSSSPGREGTFLGEFNGSVEKGDFDTPVDVPGGEPNLEREPIEIIPGPSEDNLFLKKLWYFAMTILLAVIIVSIGYLVRNLVIEYKKR